MTLTIVMLLQDQGPYVKVVVQECVHMNRLLDEVERSLVELRKGLNGQVNMSQAMEDMAAVSLRLPSLL